VGKARLSGTDSKGGQSAEKRTGEEKFEDSEKMSPLEREGGPEKGNGKIVFDYLAKCRGIKKGKKKVKKCESLRMIIQKHIVLKQPRKESGEKKGGGKKK